MIEFEKYDKMLEKSYIVHLGRVNKVIGLTIESLGPNVNVGDACLITSQDQKRTVLAEVVGFRENNILLMPLDDMEGIGPGSQVKSIGHPLQVSVTDGLLGRVLDGLGKPIDNKRPFLYR